MTIHNPKIKCISFENYIKFFKDTIAVRDEAVNPSYSDTPIFYKIDMGIINISFSYGEFLIETKTILKDYESKWNEETIDTMTNKNSKTLLEWFNAKYMDNRGIPED